MKLKEFARESKKNFNGSKKDVPIVGLEHLNSGEMLFSDYDLNTENTFTKSFSKGQVLFGRRRAYLKKAAFAEFDGICSGDITVIEAIPGKVLPELLPFIIQNDKLFDFAISRSAGGLSPRVKWKDLAEFEFDLPSLADQKKLADKLWAAYRLKESYKKLLASMDELAKSRFIEMFGDVILNEKNWGVKKWKDVLTIKNGRSQKNVLDANGKYPIYGSGGVMGRASAYITKANSIIIGRKGTIDKPFIVKEDFWNVDTAFGIEPDNKNISLYYLFFFCLFFDLKRLNKAAVLPSLVKSDLLNILMPIPPISIQNKFTLFIEQLDKSKSELKKSIAAIDDVIRSLIN